VITNIGIDERCDVHQMLMGIREGKESWLEIYSPGNPACDDNGELWSQLVSLSLSLSLSHLSSPSSSNLTLDLSQQQLNSLIECCCRRKRFFESLMKTSMSGCMSRADLDDTACQNILCDILELEMLTPEEDSIREAILESLQRTDNGRKAYQQLCLRQEYLKQLVSSHFRFVAVVWCLVFL